MGASLLKNVQYSTYISDPNEGESGILRHPLYAKRELSQKMAYGCETVLESFEINLKRNRHKCNFLGYRKKIKKGNYLANSPRKLRSLPSFILSLYSAVEVSIASPAEFKAVSNES